MKSSRKKPAMDSEENNNKASLEEEEEEEEEEERGGGGEEEGASKREDSPDAEMQDEEEQQQEQEAEAEAPKLEEGFYEIEAIRKRRVRKGQLQYLIKWYYSNLPHPDFSFKIPIQFTDQKTKFSGAAGPRAPTHGSPSKTCRPAPMSSTHSKKGLIF